MTWEEVGRVLASERPAPDVLVVRRGRLLPGVAPRSGSEMRRVLAESRSLCLRRTERCNAGMAAIAADLESLGVAQTAGVMDYFFRANTSRSDRSRCVENVPHL